MKRLYLVRHGEAEGSEGRAVGHLDLPLSPSGARRMEALATSWLGPTPGRLFTSDLRRAAESAHILSSRLRCSPIIDSRLRELSFGDWEGLRWDEIHQLYQDHLAAWGERWWQTAPPGGETFRDLSERVLAWFRELGREEEIVVMVAHGGSLRALISAILHLPQDKIFDYRLDCAHVSGIAAGGIGKLLFLNQDRFPRKMDDG